MFEKECTVFREILRKNRKISDAECAEVLTKEKRGVLAVNGDDGYPYAMPMNHYYSSEDGIIYFHTGRVGHRLDSIRHSNKVSFCITESGTRREGEWALDVRSVVVFGRIEVIDDLAEVTRITSALSRKFTSDEEYIQNEIARFAKATLILKLTPEHVTGKLVNES